MLSLEFCRSFKKTYFVAHRKTASSEISTKNQNSMLDKFLVLMMKCSGKNINLVSNRTELNI